MAGIHFSQVTKQLSNDVNINFLKQGEGIYEVPLSLSNARFVFFSRLGSPACAHTELSINF